MTRRGQALEDGGFVYSTEPGALCPHCRHPKASCVCRRAAASGKGGGVRVLRETKGRRGKEVTVIRGLVLDPVSLEQLCRHFKTVHGSGGTVRDGVIELQGDHVDDVIAHLQGQGMAVKRAGG